MIRLSGARTRSCAVTALSLLLVLGCAATSRAQENSASYLSRLADRAAAWREVLPAMEGSADRAAAGAIAGGNLYAYASRGAFVSEACGRAGGLMMIGADDARLTLTAQDTVLAASSNAAADEDLARVVERAHRAGAQVVLFGESALPPQIPGVAAFTWPADEGVSIGSMSDVLGMWAWTGRFIAACVERGKMPCVYQSYLLPGGRQRGAYLQQSVGGRFHEVTAVRPGDAAGIAEDYLRFVEGSLRAIEADSGGAIVGAAAALRAVRDAGGVVAIHTQGHLFPGEFDHPAQPPWLIPVERVAFDARPGAAVVLDYQATPWELLAALHHDGGAVVWTCAQHAAAELARRENWFYVDPHWPLTDAVVQLRGYDVPVLPASGVLDAAVYWQLIERVAER